MLIPIGLPLGPDKVVGAGEIQRVGTIDGIQLLDEVHYALWRGASAWVTDTNWLDRAALRQIAQALPVDTGVVIDDLARDGLLLDVDEDLDSVLAFARHHRAFATAQVIDESTESPGYYRVGIGELMVLMVQDVLLDAYGFCSVSDSIFEACRGAAIAWANTHSDIDPEMNFGDPSFLTYYFVLMAAEMVKADGLYFDARVSSTVRGARA